MGKAQPLDDGGAVVLGNVLEGSQGNLVVANLRMIFVPGTPPAEQLKHNPPQGNDEWHVLGIPRVSLETISSWIKGGGGNVNRRKLPYEMIIVGVSKK